MWGQGFGEFGHIGGDGNAATVSRSLGGLMLGADAYIDDRYRIGVAAGYTKSWLNIDPRASSGSVESIFGGLYGGADFASLRLRAGALYSGNGYDTSRTIVFPGFQDTARSSYSGDTVQAFGEIGWPFSVPGATVEPFAGGLAMHIHTDDFAEAGGVSALSGPSRSYDYQATTIGIRLASEPLSGIIVRGLLGWRHGFGDLAPVSLLAFNDASLPFPITGAPIARDSLVAETGVDWRLTHSASAGIFYSGVISDKSYANAVQGRVKINF